MIGSREILNVLLFVLSPAVDSLLISHHQVFIKRHSCTKSADLCTIVYDFSRLMVGEKVQRRPQTAADDG